MNTMLKLDRMKTPKTVNALSTAFVCDGEYALIQASRFESVEYVQFDATFKFKSFVCMICEW